jgi:hypothetical protein
MASLLWGLLLDHQTHTKIFNYLDNVDSLSKLIGLSAAGGFVVFTFGYVIGTITYFLLGIFFRVCPGRSRFHEVSLSADALDKMWVTLRCGNTMDKREQELSAGVAFDHGLLRENYEGVHLWLVRRWSAFSIGQLP